MHADHRPPAAAEAAQLLTHGGRMPGDDRVEEEVDDAARRRRQPLVTTPQVVDVAYGLVAQDGPEGLSMRKLATALHVSLPTVYSAINRREELVRHLQIRLVEDTAAAVANADIAAGQRADGMRAPEAADDRLGLLIGALLRWTAEHPRLAEFLLAEPIPPDLAARLAQPRGASGEGVSYLIGLCRELVALGRLPDVDPVRGVAFAFAQIRAMLALTDQPAFAAVGTETWQAAIRATLLAGLEQLAAPEAASAGDPGAGLDRDIAGNGTVPGEGRKT